MQNILNEAIEISEYTRKFRRDFHQHPELGFNEVRTSGIVVRELTQMGLEVRSGIAKTGVVALLEGSAPGPVVLIRCDMDALPVNEETGAIYCSQTPGVMHACAHDGHTAIGLTVAKILAAHKNEIKGTIKFMFQPAEEMLGGAAGMVKEGILENPKPDFALALHLWLDHAIGWMGVVPGPVMAYADRFAIRVIGVGGHGATPQLTSDPIVASGQIISALQSIVARNVSPRDSAVLTVGSISGGDVYNVIPSVVELKGAIRSFLPEVRERVIARFEQTTKNVAEAMGCKAEVEIVPMCSAVCNDPRVTQVVQEAIKRTLPDTDVDVNYQTMISEDMSEVLNVIPGCYFMVGAANTEKGFTYGHHHPKFDFDEDALPKAVAAMTAAALSLLGQN